MLSVAVSLEKVNTHLRAPGRYFGLPQGADHAAQDVDLFVLELRTGKQTTHALYQFFGLCRIQVAGFRQFRFEVCIKSLQRFVAG